MTLRFARHTNDLEAIKSFYITILDFELLGSFENHNNYNGVFLGFQNADWHLEFTVSNEKTNHHQVSPPAIAVAKQLCICTRSAAFLE